jgi:hypothetical protein
MLVYSGQIVQQLKKFEIKGPVDHVGCLVLLGQCLIEFVLHQMAKSMHIYQLRTFCHAVETVEMVVMEGCHLKPGNFFSHLD